MVRGEYVVMRHGLLLEGGNKIVVLWRKGGVGRRGGGFVGGEHLDWRDALRLDM